MDPIIGGLAIAGGTALANNGIQAMFARNEQKQYEKNLQRNFELSQQAQKNAAKNMVDGFRMAGLSPALAAGANFSAANVPAAPLQNKASHPMDMASMFQATKQLELLEAEKNAANAQASKSQADADKTKIESGRMSREDLDIKDMMQQAISRVKQMYGHAGLDTSSLDDFANYLDSPDTAFNMGSFSAALSSMQYERALSQNLSGDIDDALESLISQHKIKEDVASDITSMSHSQRKLLSKQLEVAVKQLALMQSQIGSNNARAALDTETVQKVKKEQDYILQETARSKVNTDNIKNADFRTAYESGNPLKTVRILGLDGLHNLLNMIGLLMKR